MNMSSTREQIIEAADLLFYQRGYEHTSFADISKSLNISRGNFYHHFKTKDDILDAVIAHRIDKTKALLHLWEHEQSSPARRIISFIHILIANKTKIMRHGCPVGTLCNELAKLDHAAKGAASTLFILFRDWLAAQFRSLGKTKEADALAMHLLMRSQGIATLATAMRDDIFIRREIAGMEKWLKQQIISKN